METNCVYRSLWATVLERACLDMKSRDPLILQQTEYWFSRTENTGVGAFYWICETLGLEPDKVRQKFFPSFKKTA